MSVGPEDYKFEIGRWSLKEVSEFKDLMTKKLF